MKEMIAVEVKLKISEAEKEQVQQLSAGPSCVQCPTDKRGRVMMRTTRINKSLT